MKISVRLIGNKLKEYFVKVPGPKGSCGQLLLVPKSEYGACHCRGSLLLAYINN